MSRPAWPRCSLLALVLALAAPTAVAGAHEAEAGGASYDVRPEVRKVECLAGAKGACAHGELLKVSGEELGRSDSVVFLGRSGRSDDRRAKPHVRSPHRVIVRVPDGALSGPLRVVSRAAGSSRASRRVRVAAPAPDQQPAPAPAVPAGEGVFPVRASYTFGSATNGFGGGRGHQGQDVFADCGSPVVAARSGVVTRSAFEARAGNYVVLTADDGTSQAYMHMLRPSGLVRGARVPVGQVIGQVGETGGATGCHLHYESWTAPGWYQGGTAIDPMPELRAFAAHG